MSLIPFDIIEAIVGELEDATLRTWSTVSRSFLDLNRRRLFSVITLNHSSRCKQLYEILLKNCDPACYITELYIDTKLFRNTSWITTCESLAPLLQLLGDAEVLQIFSVDGKLGIHWHDFPLTHREAFLHLLKSPSINSLSLNHIFTGPFPVELLPSSPSLKHLSYISASTEDEAIQSTLVPGPSEPGYSSTAALRELESLKIGGPYARNLIDLLLAHNSPLQASRVRDLFIDGSRTDLLNAVWDLMCASKTTLTSLTWNNPHDQNDPTRAPLDIQILQNLRFLTFNLDFLSDDDKVMIAALKNSDLPLNLEELIINIVDNYDHHGFAAEYGDYQYVDEELASIITSKCFPCCRHIKIRVCATTTIRQFWQDGDDGDDDERPSCPRSRQGRLITIYDRGSEDDSVWYDDMLAAFCALDATGKLSLEVEVKRYFDVTTL